MPIARITPIGGDLYHVHVMEGGEHPSQGLPGGGYRPVDPGFGRPGWDRPVDPGYGRPEGGRPDNALPGAPGSPGNELPANPPPQVAPGTIIAMIRGPHGRWEYAAIQPGSPPPRPMPQPPGGEGIWPKPGHPGNTLPGSPGHPSQGLPVQPGHPDQGLPPIAQPKF